jgi:hypothetical protein
MDTKGEWGRQEYRRDSHYYQLLYETYRLKYTQLEFDVILCADDNAFLFLRQYHNELFPNTPIIYCGLEEVETGTLEGMELFRRVAGIQVDQPPCKNHHRYGLHP